MDANKNENTDQLQKQASYLDPALLSYLRVAVAVAICRRRPRHLSARQYAEQLCQEYQSHQLHTEQQLQQLHEEVVLLRQQVLLKQTQEMVREATASAESDAVTDDNASQVLFPTPPCSSERTHSPTHSPTHPGSPTHDLTDPPHSATIDDHPDVRMAAHAQFLSSVMTLSRLAGDGRVSDRLADHTPDTVLQTVRTALQAVSRTLIHATHRPRDTLISPKVVNHCVDVICDLVHCDTMATEFVEAMVELVGKVMEDMVEALATNTDINSHDRQEALCLVLLRLVAGGRHLQQPLCRLLLHALEQCARCLRHVVAGSDTLQPHTLENSYHILWTLERLLCKRSLRVEASGGEQAEGGQASAFSEEVLAAVSRQLEDAVLHLSRDFPLYAQYVWRLGALVAPR